MADIFPSEAHRMVLLTTLKTLGVTKVTVEFSGGGDSGAIDEVILTTAAGNIEPDFRMIWPKVSSAFDESVGNWVKVEAEHSMGVKDVIESVTYAALDYVGLDWYNNEGGQGSFTIDLMQNPPDINLDVGINIRETEDHAFNFSGRA